MQRCLTFLKHIGAYKFRPLYIHRQSCICVIETYVRVLQYAIAIRQIVQEIYDMKQNKVSLVMFMFHVRYLVE